jgi:tRNA-splicing ligase RtcB
MVRLKIAKYWINIAKKKVKTVPKDYNDKMEDIIQNTIPESDIPNKLEKLKNEFGIGIDKEFLEGDDLIGYLHDMIFAQYYAQWNRETILKQIKKGLKIKKFEDKITSVHNYIDFNDFIIRKGAISSYEGQRMIIPLNMRDGSLICEGKSNIDWNYSAPHGAGRVMSRSKAKEMIDLKDFQKTMKGIYSTSVCKATLDESPFAYKSSKLIEKAIEPTATILERLTPVLNIKDNSEALSKEDKKDKFKKDRKRKRDKKEIRQMKGNY